ncbi:hypothetical protein AX14_008494, partial [Amanita brunnescens Koide BX004]
MFSPIAVSQAGSLSAPSPPLPNILSLLFIYKGHSFIMPRMLLSLALLCFALPSSSATQTDSHREIVPEIANGTNQDPPDPPKPPQDPRYDPGYSGPGFGIHHPQDPRYNLGYPDPGYGMPPQDPRYDHGY